MRVEYIFSNLAIFKYSLALAMQLSYMTIDYIIKVNYKLEFRYIQKLLFHRQYQVLDHTWK